ncbi:ubiquitin carboxyl-terminal hydrolase-like protein 4 [Leptotrombidium deliense]|uniref:Ubiquitin carboxyl-terminal hydrolase n=1 Tax=Leptotrombidium deliense TaxID=299467 RepID=A0A443SNR0_9ACAR|nr:ubiquitin carboxyl-terminal hydrolase-like protein 4 [Leptotrombidium deliense]
MSFLDLRNATEKERKEIEEILTRRSDGVELPFEFGEPVDNYTYVSDPVSDDSDRSRDECKNFEEDITTQQMSIMSSGHPGYLPAFIGNQSSETMFDPKRQPIITQESFKGHYYPTAFAPQMAISSKPTPDSIKVPFYSSPPHFAPVITSISHVSPSVGSSAAAISPSGIAVVTSTANSIVEDSDGRVPVTGNSYPMQAAFPHPYTANPYIPSHGATLPMPAHMYPVYFPVQLAPQFYAPLPQPMTQNHAPRHQTVNRTVSVAQNGSVTGPVDQAVINGGPANEVNETKSVEVKCEDQSVESKSESAVNSEKSESLLKCIVEYPKSDGEITAVETHSCETGVVSTEKDEDVNCSVNERNEDISFGDLSDKGCESINSSTVSLASSKDTVTVTSGTRSWADLFKGHDAANIYNTTSLVLPSQINSQPSQNDSFPGDNTSLATVADSNCKLLDAQNIALNEDSLVHKLGKKLREINLKHSLPFLIPRGFVNRGNWCYINATLQALLYCPPFYNLMREIGEVSGICREKSCTPIIDSFAKFFANFLPSEPMMKKAKSGSFSSEDLPTADPFEPKCIYDVLGVIKSECLKGKQEDAEEFLSSVLNGLHDEMVMLFRYVDSKDEVIKSNGHSNDECDSENDTKINCDDDSSLWREVGPRHKALPMRSTNVVATPISDIFGGSILSVRTAGKDVCGNRQPFFTLQLDIQSEKIKSIEDALKMFTSSESLQGYTCPKTKQNVDASYQSFLNQLPPILILHLKLFGYDKDGGSRKLLKKIEYPIDFEFPRECIHHDRSADKNKYSKSYKLLAVVHHDGHESIKGHYITDIFHIGSSLWLRCDDNTIKPISTQQMLNPQPPRVPYLLFYRRCDTLRGHNQPQRGLTMH